jgi:SAM-dependent methyltransferase
MEDFLHDVRAEEFDLIFGHLGIDTGHLSVLEVGSGTGQQLDMLSKIFREAAGIDIKNGTYAQYKTEKVREYDGFNIPFGDGTFDIVFSSNVLEHIPHLEIIGKEFRRVLRPNGYCIHIMPTHTWKFWSLFTHYLAFVPRKLFQSNAVQSNGGDSKKKSTIDRVLNALFPERHGERGNRFNEFFYFRPSWWLKHFKETGWEVVSHFPVGLFYTGNSLLSRRLSMQARKKMAVGMGSSGHVYIVKQATIQQGSADKKMGRNKQVSSDK